MFPILKKRNCLLKKQERDYGILFSWYLLFEQKRIFKKIVKKRKDSKKSLLFKKNNKIETKKLVK